MAIMPVNFETRDMTADDMVDVLSIESVSFPTPWSEGMFREEMQHPFCHDLVAHVADHIVGYICFAIVSDEVHLRNLAVLEDWKRQGVGLNSPVGDDSNSLRHRRPIRHSRGKKIEYGCIRVIQ